MLDETIDTLASRGDADIGERPSEARHASPRFDAGGSQHKGSPATKGEPRLASQLQNHGIMPRPEPVKNKRSVKRILLPFIALALASAGGWYGYNYYVDGRFLVSTDDAYLGADMSIVSPKVGGYVESVPVEENQRVRAGDPLVIIDPGDFKLAVDAANAKIATQQATVERNRAQRTGAEASVQEAQANVTAAETMLAQGELDLSRAQDLARRGAGAKALQDSAKSGRNAASAKLAAANAQLSAAKANVTILDAQKVEAERLVDELRISRDKAERDLSFTVLKAPYDGVVGNLSVQPGDLVSAGRRLASIVPVSNVYVDGNFKETQLSEIVPGQKATIEIDALPGRTLTGTVTSLSPASGSVFSLLPGDNATGNFTKVTQRVPVRIEIDSAEALAGMLRPGLSAVVSIDTRTTPDETASASAQTGPVETSAKVTKPLTAN